MSSNASNYKIKAKKETEISERMYGHTQPIYDAHDGHCLYFLLYKLFEATWIVIIILIIANSAVCACHKVR